MQQNISVEQAKSIILDGREKTDIIEIPILESLGHVLANDVKSHMDMPPFDRSPLDGYALMSEDTKDASIERPVVLDVIDYVPAGYVSSKKVKNGQAIRIMTGAKIPEGADIVIKYEDTEFTKEDVKIFSYTKSGANIVRRGEDIKCGETVLAKGKVIQPADIGILATLGMSKVQVYAKLKIGILATGDELVEVDKKLDEGKIRNSNSYTLAAQIIRSGGDPEILGICKDDIGEISEKLKSALEKYDMIITTGGVSVGDADLVKEAFKKIGAEILFWKVQVKPGSPITVAKYNNKFLFGLSGNPAAASITFEQFVRPAVLSLMGRENVDLIKVKSVLKSNFNKIRNHSRYVRAVTYYKDGGFFTLLPDKHSSGVLSSLSGINSLLLIKAGEGPYKSGDIIEVELLSKPEVVV
ncbi:MULTISPECIES: molybdopterin molybdotransferase MoeA [unclassified Sedimentibacter]|uniref:molybdopterin molybdotransferase MoeA n=1 Tax=unclassified Sedimentibacter TaxID=2649220 RepID=UPI0027E010EA|nr:gephyrin-like molybdotransferase Glp [Sedimentibacter sp. MB35-C1]WMJ78269.1 molybdopterin molybdotransferase MoeA [Sedimentibacter sp. MB35-C1]